MFCYLCSRFLEGGGERQSVAEWILHRHIACAPWHFFDSWSSVLVALRCQYGVERVEVACLNPPPRTRTAVAMVLGQVQDAPVVGDLHVQGKAGLERCSQSTLKPRKST